VLGENEVGGLDVAVENGWVVPVQEREGFGRLSQSAEDGRGCQPGCSLFGQQPPQIGPLDPVHHDDVLVVMEEVVAHER
jgi:hypothetical protein